MHQSSYNIMSQFRNLVMKYFNGDRVSILDVGSYGVNGTTRKYFLVKICSITLDWICNHV